MLPVSKSLQQKKSHAKAQSRRDIAKKIKGIAHPVPLSQKLWTRGGAELEIPQKKFFFCGISVFAVKIF